MRSKEFTISREIAVALINDDYSGLYEELAIDKWLEDEGVEYITERNCEEPARFTQCEVTKLCYDCIEIIAYKQ